MTKREEADKATQPPAKRHIYGPREVSALVPALVKPAFRRRAPAAAHVMADWDVIVGPAIAGVAIPRKLFAGTLAIVCTGPVALELQHLSGQLIERINTHLGKVTVTRLRFVQDASPTAVPVPHPRPQAVAQARAAVAGLPEGSLRDALEALGRVVLTRSSG